MSEFSMTELVPLIVEVTESGGEFRLYPKGTSMRPLIRQGIDSVALVSPPKKPKRGDILLYRRESGQYVLHRLVGCDKKGALRFCGDNQTEIEKGIVQADVVACVKAVYRGDKRRNVSGFFMRIYGFCMTVSLFKRMSLAARRILAKIRKRG